jgi:hypothetical protein
MKNTLKDLISMLFLAASVSALAAGNTGPNRVYVEQIGNSNTITIEQVGGSNSVGGTAGGVAIDETGVSTLTVTAPSTSNYGTVSGSSDTIILTQHGDSNQAQYNIKGSNNNYFSTVTGNSNQTKLTIGNQNTNGLRNNVTETLIGNNNMIIRAIVGNDNVSTTSATGSDNQITETVTTSNADHTLTIFGSSNVVNAQQVDAAGGAGHSLTNLISGNYNSITTQQQGTNDTTVNLVTNGDHNTITVRTSSSTISTPVSAIVR